jgi:hypothetical protein
MSENAEGTGAANDATVSTDEDTYAAVVRRNAEAEHKAEVEAAERSVAKARAHLEAQEKELAKVKKERT